MANTETNPQLEKLEKAQRAFDKAQEKHQAALKDLRKKRAALDEQLEEAALPALAAYNGLNPEDEEDIEAARVIQRRRKEKRAARLAAFVAASEADGSGDGPVGSLS